MKWLRKSSRYFKNLKILIMESDLDIRRLDKREHLEKWLDFLECAFKEKGTPRSYFAAHVANDPYFDLSQVWVLMQSDVILSTLRIFDRHIYVDRQRVAMCGWGEVATRPDARGNGYASQLLSHVTATLQEEGKYAVGCLHSSREHLQAFYGRRGWQQVPVKYVDLNLLVNLEHLQKAVKQNSASQRSPLSFRPVDWSSDADLRILSRLYTAANAPRDGAVARLADTQKDVKYWQDWIGLSLHITSYVITTDSGKEPVAYCICRCGNDETTATCQVMEFCIDPVYQQESDNALEACLCPAISTSCNHMSPDKDGSVSASLTLPSAMVDVPEVHKALQRVGVSVNASSDRSDLGFMFKMLNSNALPLETKQRLQQTASDRDGQAEEMLLLNGTACFSRLDLF